MAQLRQDLLSLQPGEENREFTLTKDLAAQGIVVPGEHFQFPQASLTASRAHHRWLQD